MLRNSCPFLTISCPFPPKQLLMALHDLGETELCTKEACHKLAWTLDACLKVRTAAQPFYALHQAVLERPARGCHKLAWMLDAWWKRCLPPSKCAAVRR